VIKTGDTAINFNLQNIEDKSVNLYDRVPADGPMLLIFYKYDCPTCQLTFKHLPRIARGVGHQYFLAVAQDTPDEARTFKDKYKVDFEVVCDVKPYSVSRQYGMDFVPTMFIIEPDKRVSAVIEAFDKKALEGFADRIAAQNHIANFQAFSPTEQVPLLKPG
jgi:peroxiredoxin